MIKLKKLFSKTRLFYHNQIAKSRKISFQFFKDEKMEKRPKKKLLDQVRDVIRLKHYSILTEQAYVKRKYPCFKNNQATSVNIFDNDLFIILGIFALWSES